MSTRATYKILDTTIYIHFDGYPTGAADYFKAALEYDGPHAINAAFDTIFLIANARLAEITESHQAHSDTEYQYDVWMAKDSEPHHGMRFNSAETLMIRARHAGESNAFFEGPLTEFVERAEEIERAA